MDDLVTFTEPSDTHDGSTAPHPVTHDECRRAILPVHEVLSQISSKWTILVVRTLGNGSRRFSEIRRDIDGISQKMLTSTLRDLEKDGFVSRTVTPSIPPRVDYELTDMGRELGEPLRVIGEWAHANRHRVEAARERFAEREEEARRMGW